MIRRLVVVSCLLRVTRKCRSAGPPRHCAAVAAATATVVRRASPGSAAVGREVPVDQLVPGDIVELAAGDMVPADLRLLRSADLAVSQAVFTGE